MSFNLGYRAADLGSFANVDSEISKKPIAVSSSEAFQFDFQKCLTQALEKTPEKKPEQNSNDQNVKSQNSQLSKKEGQPIDSIEKKESNEDIKLSDLEEETTEDLELKDIDETESQASWSLVSLHGKFLAEGGDNSKDFILDTEELDNKKPKKRIEIGTSLLNNNKKAVVTENLSIINKPSEQEFNPDALKDDLELVDGLKVSDLNQENDSSLLKTLLVEVAEEKKEFTNENKQEDYPIASLGVVEETMVNKNASSPVEVKISKELEFDKEEYTNQDKTLFSSATEEEVLNSSSKITVEKFTEPEVNKSKTKDDVESEIVIVDAEASNASDMQENSRKNLDNFDDHRSKSLENEDAIHSEKTDITHSILSKDSSTQVTEESSILFVEKFTDIMLSKLQDTIKDISSINSKITELTIENEGIKFTVTIESSKGLLSKVNITSDDPTSLKLLMRDPLKLEQSLQKIQNAEDCSLTFNQHQGNDSQNQQRFMMHKQGLENLKFINSEYSEEKSGRVNNQVTYSQVFSINNSKLKGGVDIFC